MYNPDAFVTLEFPYNREFLEDLLDDFCWDFQDGKVHPVTTGNCSGHEPASGGNLDSGWYQNASYSCSHCYPSSNPACLEWSKESDYILLSGVPESTKFQRALGLAHKYHQELWNHAYKAWQDEQAERDLASRK